jgi:hypothetical protein
MLVFDTRDERGKLFINDPQIRHTNQAAPPPSNSILFGFNVAVCSHFEEPHWAEGAGRKAGMY